MQKSIRSLLNKHSINTIYETLFSFVCMLTDEQLVKWWENSVVTIRALSNSVDKDTDETKQFILEEELKKAIIEDVCLRRQVKLATPNY